MIYLKRFIFLQIDNDFLGLLLKNVLKCDPQKNYLLVVASLTILQLKSLQCEIYCFKIIYEFICWVRCVYKQSMLKRFWLYFWKPFWINFSSMFCFISYLAAWQPVFIHYWRDSLTHPMLLTVLSTFDTKVSKRLLISLVPKRDWNSSGILARNPSIHLKHKHPLSYSPQVLIELLLAIRLFQKKSKQGGNSRQNEASPWKFKGEGEIPTPETKGEIPRPETKTFGNFTIFSCSPLEFPHSFFSISLAIPCPLPPCLNFFWKVNLRNCFV